MADGPFGIVRQRVDRAQRQQAALKGRHAIERDRGDEAFQHRINAHLVPRAAQRQEAIGQPAP